MVFWCFKVIHCTHRPACVGVLQLCSQTARKTTTGKPKGCFFHLRLFSPFSSLHFLCFSPLSATFFSPSHLCISISILSFLIHTTTVPHDIIIAQLTTTTTTTTTILFFFSTVIKCTFRVLLLLSKITLHSLYLCFLTKKKKKKEGKKKKDWKRKKSFVLYLRRLSELFFVFSDLINDFRTVCGFVVFFLHPLTFLFFACCLFLLLWRTHPLASWTSSLVSHLFVSPSWLKIFSIFFFFFFRFSPGSATAIE